MQTDKFCYFPFFRLRAFRLTSAVLFLCNCLFSQNSVQGNPPVPGSPMPKFLLKNVEYYSKTEVSTDDFKGKWLLLDFWYRGCGSCIKSFPKIKSLQERFSDQIQFLLVGGNSEMLFGKGIRPLYEKMREKLQLDLPIVYDSVLVQHWNINSFPHIVIVNPNGIVYSITAGHDITNEKIENLIKGKDVSFEPKDVEKPFFEGRSVSVTDENVVYRSVLTHWAGEEQHGGEAAYQFVEGNSRRFQVAMAPLIWLYKIAWLGKSGWLPTDKFYSTIYPFPVFAIADRSVFNFDFIKGTGLYNYDVKFSFTANMDTKVAEKKVMSSLQKDLQTSFGISAAIEKRRMPVWKLIAKPGTAAKLKSKGGPPGFVNDITGDGGVGGFEFKNYPVSALLGCINRYHFSDEPPFFDETGITGKIDFKMDALMTDLEQVKKELQKNGLDLVKGEKEMKVLVIRDSK